MKRLLIVCVLLAGMVCLSTYSALRVTRVNREMGLYLETLYQLIGEEEADRALIVATSEEMRDYWYREEHTLIYFLRHSQVDEMTHSVTRLPALSRHGDTSQLGAELDTIRWQMEHIRESEIPSFHTVM